MNAESMKEITQKAELERLQRIQQLKIIEQKQKKEFERSKPLRIQMELDSIMGTILQEAERGKYKHQFYVGYKEVIDKLIEKGFKVQTEETHGKILVTVDWS